LAIGLLDYLTLASLRTALGEMNRVLAPGGRVVLSYNRRWWGAPLRHLMPGRNARVYHDDRHLSECLRSEGFRAEGKMWIGGGLLSPDTLLLLARKCRAGGPEEAIPETSHAARVQV